MCSNPKLIGECHIDTTTLLIEEDVAISEGKKSVIPSHADVSTWVPLGAALANEDVAGDDNFTSEFLNAEALTV